jgi:hypothetical protein
MQPLPERQNFGLTFPVLRATKCEIQCRCAFQVKQNNQSPERNLFGDQRKRPECDAKAFLCRFQ